MQEKQKGTILVCREGLGKPKPPEIDSEWHQQKDGSNSKRELIIKGMKKTHEC